MLGEPGHCPHALGPGGSAVPSVAASPLSSERPRGGGPRLRSLCWVLAWPGLESEQECRV